MSCNLGYILSPSTPSYVPYNYAGRYAGPVENNYGTGSGHHNHESGRVLPGSPIRVAQKNLPPAFRNEYGQLMSHGVDCRDLIHGRKHPDGSDYIPPIDFSRSLPHTRLMPDSPNYAHSLSVYGQGYEHLVGVSGQGYDRSVILRNSDIMLGVHTYSPVLEYDKENCLQNYSYFPQYLPSQNKQRAEDKTIQQEVKNLELRDRLSQSPSSRDRVSSTVLSNMINHSPDHRSSLVKEKQQLHAADKLMRQNLELTAMLQDEIFAEERRLDNGHPRARQRLREILSLDRINSAMPGASLDRLMTPSVGGRQIPMIIPSTVASLVRYKGVNDMEGIVGMGATTTNVLNATDTNIIERSPAAVMHATQTNVVNATNIMSPNQTLKRSSPKSNGSSPFGNGVGVSHAGENGISHSGSQRNGVSYSGSHGNDVSQNSVNGVSSNRNPQLQQQKPRATPHEIRSEAIDFYPTLISV